ncbi:hypothetical protein RhiirC2_791808 [Rhizophagus irregularis]|uniref:Uncharacterized protein n=1 Tax=Rhizophagus irregularis TaxID=588596 RepID=A0A2N1MII1_9GLOM|nr:hypothetical protein RhiirC2_791808 [Rhizophagus irregularis]
MKDYVESGVISLSKTNGILKITNASKEKMQVVRQGISQIKTPYNFSRIDFADQHNEERKNYFMFTLRYEFINATINRTFTSLDTNTCNDIHKHFELYKQSVLADKILTNNEKIYVCLATLYCEYYIRNYLKENFLNWTSGNDYIDNLIQKYQLELLIPNMIVEWIPFSNLENIKYFNERWIF